VSPPRQRLSPSALLLEDDTGYSVDFTPYPSHSSERSIIPPLASFTSILPARAMEVKAVGRVDVRLYVINSVAGSDAGGCRMRHVEEPRRRSAGERKTDGGSRETVSRAGMAGRYGNLAGQSPQEWMKDCLEWKWQGTHEICSASKVMTRANFVPLDSLKRRVAFRVRNGPGNCITRSGRLSKAVRCRTRIARVRSHA